MNRKSVVKKACFLRHWSIHWPGCPWCPWFPTWYHLESVGKLQDLLSINGTFPFMLRCWSNPLHPKCWDVPTRREGPNLHHCLDTGLALHFFGYHNSARWRFKGNTSTESTTTIVCKFASPEKLVGWQPRCLLLLRRRQRRRGGLCRLPPAWDQGQDDPRHTVWNIFFCWTIVQWAWLN